METLILFNYAYSTLLPCYYCAAKEALPPFSIGFKPACA